jgi:hypothetical protein
VNPRGGEVERDVALDEFLRRVSSEVAESSRAAMTA